MDLKNIDLKNLKFEDIKIKILAVADKKTLIKFGIGFGSIIVFLIIYYSILNPIVQKKKVQIEDMINKKAEIAKFEKEIIGAKKKIKKLTPEHKKHSSLFHSKKEVEGLYESLSYYAGANSLVISKILISILFNLPSRVGLKPMFIIPLNSWFSIIAFPAYTPSFGTNFILSSILMLAVGKFIFFPIPFPLTTIPLI